MECGGELALGDIGSLQIARIVCRTRVGGNAAEIPIGQDSVGKRGKGDTAHALLAQNAGQPLLRHAVEHGILRLMDEERRAHLAQGADHDLRLCRTAHKHFFFQTL